MTPTERATLGDAAWLVVERSHGDLSYAQRVAELVDDVLAERAGRRARFGWTGKLQARRAVPGL